MNLIKQLGGYSAAKNWLDKNEIHVNHGYMKKYQRELLEYRRAHNIFEVGDAMVIPSRGNGIFYFNAFFFDGDIAEARHATDLEIKAGHRL